MSMWLNLIILIAFLKGQLKNTNDYLETIIPALDYDSESFAAIPERRELYFGECECFAGTIWAEPSNYFGSGF